MTRRQRIFFQIGTWACLVTSGIHAIGQIAPRPAPANETEATLLRLLTTYRKDLGAGFSRTTMDFVVGFSWCFSLFLLWVGLLGLLALRRGVADAEWFRRAALVNAILAGGLLVLGLKYFFLPPIVCVAVIFLGFAGAAVPGPRAR